MPLFSNKFTNKSSKVRKTGSLLALNQNLETDKFKEDALQEFEKIMLELDDNKCLRLNDDNGAWTLDHNLLISLEEVNQALKEENLSLKLKIEVLIDLVRFCNFKNCNKF